MKKYEKYIESVVLPILDVPEELKISCGMDEMGILAQIKVAQPDMGKIIGKNGETARAIRQLLHVFGGKEKARISMKILEPEE